ncbi:FG-GAP repeat domain-containing protein [Haloarchaeobius sp. TZWSO28]|uniref:FG-GAP repeat domain-containing protein n=1 Tax=Haloarchaeobius sp. TZWSO28 TaxID=3446119 RepID=UPI003EBD4089
MHPLVDPALNWDHETRIGVGDVDDDGALEVVISESELDANARLAVLSRTDDGPWEHRLLFDAGADRRALHTLELADLDGDGLLEVVTAEMENDKTDGESVTPRWWCLGSDGENWERRVLLDENLGSHCARVLDVDGDGRPDIVGKVWRANDRNGTDGLNHVDCLRNVTE